jgi:hypothetical protein
MSWFLSTAFALGAIGSLAGLIGIHQRRDRRKHNQMAKSLLVAIQLDRI